MNTVVFSILRLCPPVPGARAALLYVGGRPAINWRTIRPWGDTAENSPCHGPQAWEGLHATAGVVSLLGSLGAVASSAATRTSPTRPRTAATTHASTTGSKLTSTLARSSPPRPQNPIYLNASGLYLQVRH